MINVGSSLGSQMIRLNYVDYTGSVCDGPGIRTVVFLQGCSRHCHGCHNPQTWDLAGGYSISIFSLLKEITVRSRTRRVTISGGEPLEQVRAVTDMAILLKNDGFDVGLYTSYSEFDVPSSLYKSLNFLKTGEFREELFTSIIPFVGSSNQIFHDLEKNAELKTDEVKKCS